MKFCSNCGSELQANADVCLKCGKSHLITNNTSYSNDKGGFGWGLLGFCIPIVGLILYLVWNTEKPLNAKAAGMGALISVVLSIIMYVIIVLAAISAY